MEAEDGIERGNEMIVEKEKEVRGSARWGKPHMKKGVGN